jgi:hypothetical protein
MKKELIEKIKSKLNYILDLPISFVEMGFDSIIQSKTKKELKLIEKLYIDKVSITTYKNGVLTNELTVSYESLTVKEIMLIDIKLTLFNKDLNDKFYRNLFNEYNNNYINKF